jgi:hypothetical protein
MEQNVQNPTPNTEKLGIGLSILCFLIPLVGLILFFVYKAEKPAKSKGACYAALAGFLVGVVINLISIAMA